MGMTIRKVVLHPGCEETVTRPRIDSMFRFTTSMPTPRPETSVTFSAVENPGTKIRLKTSSSSSSSPSWTRPFLVALRRMASRWSPRPSSESSTTIEPPSW